MARMSLALCYSEGRGVKRDYSEAMKWLLPSVGQENSDVQNSSDDYCRIEDYLESFSWYQLSAEQGNSDAQFLLGFWYQFGLDGVDRNLELAVNWYRKSAEQGNKLAVAALKRID